MVYVAADGAAVGVIAISDALRQEAPAAVAALQAAGVRCAMLTGEYDVVPTGFRVHRILCVRPGCWRGSGPAGHTPCAALGFKP